MTINAQKLSSEQEFHNQRVLSDSENRQDQKKFYTAIRDCNERYMQLVRESAIERDVLEYGCFTGSRSLELSPTCKTITGIDISDLAIEKAKESAEKAGLTNTNFIAMNAEAMDFPDNSFDLVFGSGILHHLDLDKSYAEIARVLRPGGQAIFIEPFGHNILLNAYRAITPKSRTVDEHPLLWKDLRNSKNYFKNYTLNSYGFMTLAGVPFRNTSFAKPLNAMLRRMDKVLFRFPIMQRQAWVGLLQFYK